MFGDILSYVITSITFPLSHWLFAEKYWILSFKILASAENVESTKKDLNCANKFSLSVKINIFLWPFISMMMFLGSHYWNWGAENLNLYGAIFFFTLFTCGIFLIFSLIILFDAFRRIKNFAKDSTNSLIIDERIMKIHLISYSFCVASMLTFILSFI